MAHIKMPQLGESVTEGTIAKWLKRPGDRVEKYEPLCEVITDKVNAEIPSDFEGVLASILVHEGETVPVGTVIAVVEEASAPVAKATPAAGGLGAGEAGATEGAGLAEKAAEDRGHVAAPEVGGVKFRFSPAVRRLLQEHDLDPSQIQGTGAGGRITRKDVLAFIEQRGPGRQPAHLPDFRPGAAKPAGQMTEDGDRVIPVTPVRQTIAKRMLESKHTVPHAWTMVEADVTNLVKFRESVKAEFQRKEGISLTFLPFFIKAVVEALKEYPILNSTWAGEKIIIKKRIHISIAVATDDALFVPVIKDADRMSIFGLAHAIHDLATRARAGKLTPEDMAGGTFTVNNTGAFGSILSQPIINPPQAAILSVESIVKRPVVLENDAIAIRSMVNLCLSLDHRVLDGWVCGKFLSAVKRWLETFDGSKISLY